MQCTAAVSCGCSSFISGLGNSPLKGGLPSGPGVCAQDMSFCSWPQGKGCDGDKGSLPPPFSWRLIPCLSHLPGPAQKNPSSFFQTKLLWFFFPNFVYLWLCWVFTAARGLSLVVARRDCSSLCVDLLQWRPLLQSAGSRGHWLQWSQLTVLVAPQHVGSSLTRDWICVPCISRQILKHWTTREVQRMIFRNQDMGSTCIH